jgi:hypothetical protein
MKITATLEATHSRRDSYGNTYWALRWVDHETGRETRGTVSGGKSNIYAILRETPAAKVANDWDRSVRFEVAELPIREFNRMTKGLPYAGCTPASLWAFIERELSKEITP